MEDIYPTILSHVNWSTLQNAKQVNTLFYYFVKKEILKRLKSIYPFGESSARIVIVTNDIYLESITCVLEDLEIIIPIEKYKVSWVRDIIRSWFIYSFRKQEFIITNKLFKSIIRIINKRLYEDDRNPISENLQTLTFKYIRENTVLEDIK